MLTVPAVAEVRLSEVLEQRVGLFYTLIMKDLGCSSNAVRLAAVFAVDLRR